MVQFSGPSQCPEPFTREEVLEACFTDILRAIRLDEKVLALVGKALQQSHQDEKQFHDEAITRLQAEHSRIQNRMERMYEDKLDGTINSTFFERKATEWRAEQDRLMRTIAEHHQANHYYMQEGVMLLELASRVADLFEKQEPREKRRRLDFVHSNCKWKEGKLTVEFRQPFDMLAVTNEAYQRERVAGSVSGDPSEKWLPFVDTYRTLLLAPAPELSYQLNTIRELGSVG